MRASFFLTPSQLSLMASSIFLPLILFHLLLATEPTSSARILLTRVSTPKYTSTNSLMNNPEYYSPGRYPLILSNDVYAMSLAIGTPPVKFLAIMDTGSNLIWTKCKSVVQTFLTLVCPHLSLVMLVILARSGGLVKIAHRSTMMVSR
ncbi:putative nepenthesin [Helianthus annuus]|nr:putative nepenthesin [Helianthus annuus]